MCLYGAKQITANDDLVCYKLVARNKETGELKSPFVCTNLTANERLTATWYSGKNIAWKFNGHEVDISSLCNGIEMVNGGCFHSFRFKDQAFDFLWNDVPLHYDHIKDDAYELVVYECIIPKDSKVIFSGLFPIRDDRGHFSFASSEIIIKEEVKAEE